MAKRQPKEHDYPLRKVLDSFVDDNGVRWEMLECSHFMPQKQDIIGPTNAVRRRCWRCYRGEPGGAEQSEPRPKNVPADVKPPAGSVPGDAGTTRHGILP